MIVVKIESRGLDGHEVVVLSDKASQQFIVIQDNEGQGDLITGEPAGDPIYADGDSYFFVKKGVAVQQVGLVKDVSRAARR